MAAASTRSKSVLYLLGEPKTVLSTIHLSSNGEALGLFCHHHLTSGLPTCQSSACVIDEVFAVWNLARIPTCRKDHAIIKLEKLYNEWSSLKKPKTCKSESHKSNEAKFCNKMNDLFDIAHANAAELIKIPEDLEFLAAQREPGRRGYMGAIDTALAAKDERRAQWKKLERARLERAKTQCQVLQTKEKASTSSASCALVEEVSSSDELESESDSSDTVEYGPSKCTPPHKRMRATKQVITPKLAAALDRTKLSDRKATFVISETTKALDMT